MRYRKLILSTNNLHKVKEIKEILASLPIEVLTKNDIHLKNFKVEENGHSLEENSIKKAKALAEITDYMVLADDSGLFVEALNGEPGIFSSRYAGEEGNDEKNNLKLLRVMKDLAGDKRRAKFLTVIALITEDKEVFTVKGECSGQIALEMDQGNYFGYEPVFIPEGYNMTFAKLGPVIKNKISHRAKALTKLEKILRAMLEDE